jgi:branched-subunit amino acid transport protein
MSTWAILIVSGVLTYLTRLSFFWLLERWKPSPFVQQALRFVPPAVFAGIVAPELLFRGGNLHLALDNLRLLSGLAAIAVAFYTRNAVLTIFLGMAVLLALQILF